MRTTSNSAFILVQSNDGERCEVVLMIKRSLSTIALVLLALAVSSPAQAQVTPPQVTPPQTTQGYPQPYPQQYPQQNPQSYPQACPPRMTPSGQEIYQRFMRHFAPLGLAPAQQQQIQSLINGFAQTHPAGTPLNVPAMRQLHQQVRAVLTPQQISMLEQENRGRTGAPHPCA